ncbi:MAG: hypothetical protein JRN04_04470 [Nitrososphaerota archaeon]|nr:hypothetical protein [Nitrososphaerota archaeon]MDG7020003.1 hypothetical protein [Nitrososphaerota archaeon]
MSLELKKKDRTKALAALFLLAVVAVFSLHYLKASSTSQSQHASATMKVYLNYADGSRTLLNQAVLPLVITTGNVGGGTSFSFVGTVSVSFSGDTITGGSCSGTVSFSSPGGVSVPSQSLTGTGSASSSPLQCPLGAATVGFSDFSSLPSGTYTLTATLSSQGSVVFTNGGPDSGVSYPAASVSASVTFTVSDGTVTGVTGSV